MTRYKNKNKRKEGTKGTKGIKVKQGSYLPKKCHEENNVNKIEERRGTLKARLRETRPVSGVTRGSSRQ